MIVVPAANERIMNVGDTAKLEASRSNTQAILVLVVALLLKLVDARSRNVNPPFLQRLLAPRATKSNPLLAALADLELRFEETGECR
jgi:hypothetical protein